MVMSEPARTHQFIIGYGPWARRQSYLKVLSRPSITHPSMDWLQFVFAFHFVVTKMQVTSRCNSITNGQFIWFKSRLCSVDFPRNHIFLVNDKSRDGRHLLILKIRDKSIDSALWIYIMILRLMAQVPAKAKTI
jgi:hypothetical protein